MVVQVIESTLVVPSEPTPTGILRLSNLEQVTQPLYTRSVYLFKNSNKAEDFFSVDVVKDALSKALVLFYPLAGRYLIGDDGRRMVDCNAEGARFVVARSERCSEEIDFEPCQELSDMFVPKAASLSFMTMLQITYLKCGGVVLGCANNHVLIDGRSAFHFFQTWAQIARGQIHNVTPPSFDNSPLRTRSPPSVTFDHPEYESKCDDNHQLVKNNSPSRVTFKLKLSNDQITSLKSLCIKGGKNTRISTFCAVSALFWKCYCVAQELPPDTETKLQFTADIRPRLRPPLPEKFFGNAVIRISANEQASNIVANSIHVAADAVKSAINKITDEYIRSFIDFIEVNFDKKLTPVKMKKSGLRIANITGMPVYEADFGWGAPELMTLAEVTGSNVISLLNEPGNSGVVAFVLLDSDDIKDKFVKAFYEELSVL